MFRQNKLGSWPAFLREIRLRFGPSAFEDYRGKLSKLTQLTTVNDFMIQFEELSDLVPEIQEPMLMSMFISGLKPEIRREVLMARPQSLFFACEIAKAQEAKLEDIRAFVKPQPNLNKPAYSPHPSSSSAGAQKSPPVDNFKVPQKPMSQTEIARRKELGLCFHCNAKWSRSHQCRHEFNILLIPDEEDEDNPEDAIVVEEEQIEEQPIQLHTLMGQPGSKSMRFAGICYGANVEILWDSGSSTNFVQLRIAEKLHLPQQPCKPFGVQAGGGEVLKCGSVCRQIPIMIQGHRFLIDFYVIELQGAEFVLGMQWFAEIGEVLTNFKDLTVQFTWEGQKIFLAAKKQTCPAMVSVQLLRKLYQNEEIFSTIQLQVKKKEESQQEEIPSSILEILQQFERVFSTPANLPPAREIDHQIHLVEGAQPVNIRPYRYPYFQKNEIETQVKEMLKAGVIRDSRSPFSSPVLLVKKKDGTWRFCVDYRALNRITIKDRFPIPTIDELLDEFAGSKVFSKLDLRAGYHQIRMREEDIPKTAFRTHHGHYEFRVMPFGLTNAPSTFQATMNKIFGAYLRRFVAVFFDDILVYSANLQDHGEHLKMVLQTLADHELFAKRSKCSFCCPRIGYLGHVLSEQGVEPDPDKVAAMIEWAVPNCVKKLRGFLGLTGYYRKFIRQYATIAYPLTELLKKDAFSWSLEAQQAFETLKEAMTRAPVLSLPDFTQSFEVETDASTLGIGAVLSQNGHPLAFFSRKLCPRMQRASTYVRELYAITQAVSKWRQYLLGRHFVIRTDHRSLKNLMNQVIQTPEQHQFLSKLLGFDFEIVYRPGKDNGAADALSRQEEGRPEFEVAELLQLSIPEHKDDHVMHNRYVDHQVKIPGSSSQQITLFSFSMVECKDVWERLRECTMSDPELKQLVTKLEEGTLDPLTYRFHDNLLYYNNRVQVGDDKSLREELIREAHNTMIGGHSGILKTYKRIANSFYWPKMKSDVQAWVSQCEVCQTTKYTTLKPSGLLQPLPIPTEIWEDITMDFIVGLPPSKGYTVIFVAIDRLSKYAHFARLPTGFTASLVASTFVDNMVKIHGMPRSIVSDRDRIFMSKFWTTMFDLNGTKLKMSSAYHPETDGQSEVLNRCIEQYLRAFAGEQSGKWASQLAWAEYWYNTTYHTAIDLTPFQAVFGRPPPPLPCFNELSSGVPAVDRILLDRSQLLQQLRGNLQRAQNRMKQQADRHRRDLELEVGSYALVKLQPYRQQSVARREYHKLSKRYFGPFEVLARIGAVSYKLKLLIGSKIHPVFHISVLKPWKGPLPATIAELPPTSVNDHPILWPEAILASRLLKQGNRIVKEVLIKWQKLTEEESSWEEFDKICEMYPAANLVDKVHFVGVGNDKNPRATGVFPIVLNETSHDEGTAQDKTAHKAKANTMNQDKGNSVTSSSNESRTSGQRARQPPQWIRDYVA